MRLVVFGAHGEVGRHAVDLALEQGHHVVAAARSQPTGADVPGSWSGAGRLERREIDVRDAEAVHRVLEGADVALWCVGVTKRSGGDVGKVSMPHVVRAAADHGVGRLVTVSGAGVTLPGDDKGRGARLISALTRRLAHDLVADKEAEHAILAASDLSWTAVRPPRLTESAATGRWRLDAHAPGLTASPVAKRDVAACMLELAGNRQWVGASPFLHTAKG